MSRGTVNVVHAIDTEGPLYESLDATFGRLWDLFGIRLEPSHQILERLRRKEIPLGGREAAVAEVIDPHLLGYNDTWDKIERMLDRIMSREFRKALPDSFGGGWIYNWFCVDHVGYEVNPRRRDMGYHNIHDRYVAFLDKYDSHQDSIQWHFHPLSTYREAHRCATSYENSPTLHQILARRVIERRFFPPAFRAGFQTERPDSNWFLEQWLPFDCTNMATVSYEDLERYNDFKNGRSGDWRGAPADWSIYHPDLYDYRKPGNLKRWIARFLNIHTRMANITQTEVDKAFGKAATGENVLLGVTDHDFRDVGKEVDLVRGLLKAAHERFPSVTFRYSNVVDAFNAVVNGGQDGPIRLKVDLFEEEGIKKLRVDTVEGDVFGPQPYLAIKTMSGRFIHDNFDFGLDGRTWHYVFDCDSVLSSDVEEVGVAANNRFGRTFVETIKAG